MKKIALFIIIVLLIALVSTLIILPATLSSNLQEDTGLYTAAASSPRVKTKSSTSIHRLGICDYAQ